MPYRKAKPWGQIKPGVGWQIDSTHPLAAAIDGAWVFNEGGGRLVSDAAGIHPLRGAITGSQVAWSVSSDGLGLAFTSGASYVNLGTTGNYTSEDFTLALSVVPGDLSDAVLIYKGGANTNGYYVQLNSPGTNEIKLITNQSGAFQVTSATSVVPGVVSRIVITRKGSVVRIFINGKEGTYTANGVHVNPVSSSDSLLLGNYTTGGAKPLIGKLYWFQCWKRALTPSEAVSLTLSPFQHFQSPRRRISSGVSGGTTVALTGVEGTGSVGSLAASVSIALTGNAVTGSVGSLTPSTGVVIALTGNEGTGSVGSLAPSVSIALSGNAVTGSVGDLTPVSGVIVALTGNSATGSVGSLAPSISIALTGNQAIGSVGSMSVLGADATVTPGQSFFELAEQSRRWREDDEPEAQPPEVIEAVKQDYERKSAVLVSILDDLQAESNNIRDRIAVLEKRKSEKAERELTERKQLLAMAEVKRAIVLEEMEVMDVAYVAAAVLTLQ